MGFKTAEQNENKERKKMLIAESDKDLQFIFKKYFEDSFDIITADKEKETLSLFKKYKPEITLIDLGLSGPNTNENIIRKIKKERNDARIVSLISGGNRLYNDLEGNLLRIVKKPIRLKELKKIIDLILKK